VVAVLKEIVFTGRLEINFVLLLLIIIGSAYMLRRRRR